MDYRWLPAELLFCAVLVATIFASTLICNLAREVERVARESRRDQFELLKYLKKTELMFEEYFARQRSEQKELARNP